MKLIQWIMVLMMVITPLGVIRAQEDPDRAAREAAIIHLNQAIPGIGRPERWEWENLGLVSNTALNCPLATGTALSTPVSVFKITLFYENASYLYHVSANGATVVPCDNKIPSSGGVPPSLATCTFDGASLVNIYQAPLRSSALLGTLGTAFPGATNFRATGRNATTDWLMVTFSGGVQVGWVGVSDITNLQGQCSQLPITDTSGVPTTCTLTANRANIRQDPSTESAILGEIQVGTVVNVVGRVADSSWWQILGGGWVAASVVTTSGSGCATLPVTGISVIDYGDCPTGYVGYRPSRLAVGDRAKIDDNSTVPNRVRSKPSISAEILFQLQAGAAFDIVDGPQCGNGIVWWFIESNGRFGWTAESDTSSADYFIEPLPRTVSTAQGVITARNVTALSVRQTLPAFVDDNSRLAWSPTGQLLAVLTIEGLKIYTYPGLQPNTQLNAALAVPTTAAQLTAFAFDPTTRYLALGFADGKLQLFNLNTAAVNVLVADNTRPITALVFEPTTSQLLASTYGEGASQLTDFALRTWNFDPLTGNAVPVLNLAASTTLPYLNATYAPDGTITALSNLTVQAYQASGFVQSATRGGLSPVLLAADPAWFNSPSYILFGNLTGIQGFNTTTGATSPTVVAFTAETAIALAADQAPSVTGQQPLLAVVIDDLALPTRTIDFYSSASFMVIHSLAVEGAQDVAFSPDGQVLAIVGAAGVQFWSAP